MREVSRNKPGIGEETSKKEFPARLDKSSQGGPGRILARIYCWLEA